jgi:DNA-binding transcriptional LysR family regulator
MDWKKLQTFLLLTRSGNLVRAAAALKTDPTTVGRRIQSLERELALTLFEHARDGRVLTEDGRRLLVHAEDMERAALSFEERSERGAIESGLVRVSASEGFGTRFIAPRIGSFVAAYPKISVDLFANSGFLNPSRKEADIAVLLAQPRKGPLKTRKLTDYALGLYMSSPTLADPDTMPLAGYIPDFIYAPELDYLGEIDLGREPTLRSSNINAQAQFIATGAAVGVLPCFIGDTDERLIRIQPEKSITRTFWLAVHQDVSAVPRVRAFIDWLVEAVVDDRRLLRGELVHNAQLAENL